MSKANVVIHLQGGEEQAGKETEGGKEWGNSVKLWKETWGFYALLGNLWLDGHEWSRGDGNLAGEERHMKEGRRRSEQSLLEALGFDPDFWLSWYDTKWCANEICNKQISLGVAQELRIREVAVYRLRPC